MRESRSSTLASIDKALELFQLIAVSDEPKNLTVLAQQIGLTTSKTLGLLNLLVNKGFVEYDKTFRHYTAGIQSIRLSQAVMNNQNLLKYAKPVMQNLEMEHDEAIYMAVLKQTEVVFLDMVDTEQPIKTTPLIGQAFPFFTNAAGKVIMAFESRDYLQNYLVRVGRKRPEVNVTAFQEELVTIRDTGVAIDVGGLGDNIISVAVAIKDYAGTVLGALTLIAPAFRVLGERLEQEIIPSMLENAQMLSSRFGYAAA